MWHLCSSRTCACSLWSATCATTTLCLLAKNVFVTLMFQQYLCLLSPECHLCNHNPLSLGQEWIYDTYFPAVPELVVSWLPFVQPQPSVSWPRKYMWHLFSSSTCACCLLSAICAAIILCLPAMRVHLAHIQSRHRQYLLCPWKMLVVIDALKQQRRYRKKEKEDLVTAFFYWWWWRGVR